MLLRNRLCIGPSATMSVSHLNGEIAVRGVSAILGWIVSISRHELIFKYSVIGTLTPLHAKRALCATYRDRFIKANKGNIVSRTKKQRKTRMIAATGTQTKRKKLELIKTPIYYLVLIQRSGDNGYIYNVFKKRFEFWLHKTKNDVCSKLFAASKPSGRIC